ncbi:hypothetical protein ABEB36_007197 [Hypothenemus hampei]|uniref:Uncharacterized protein n=1 Tax=Hypothenemus hampei TaxID=57062 RepID=A0ABD1ET56_HYPHA
MRLTSSIRQIINNPTLEGLKKAVFKAIAESAPHIRTAKENQVKILSKKFSQVNDWYLQITGLDKVYLAQIKVNALKDELLKVQDKRREIGRQLSDVRNRSIELQDEIHKVKRQEDLEKFLELMKKETEVLKLEKSISRTFQEYDQTERELFTAFTDSIRDSHEKQRAQMEYTKYLGIILSISGSFLAFVYSSIKKEQLKQIINERLDLFENKDGVEAIAAFKEINSNVMTEISSFESAFAAFQISMSQVLKKFSYEKPEKETKSIFQERYVQYVGVFLGLWLLSKLFSN